MAKFEVQTSDNEGFQVVRNEPLVLATCDERRTAERIVRTLSLSHYRREKAQSVQKFHRNPLVPMTKSASVEVPQKSAVQKVIESIEELKDQAGCGICGTRFSIAPDRQDICARCSAR